MKCFFQLGSNITILIVSHSFVSKFQLLPVVVTTSTTDDGNIDISNFSDFHNDDIPVTNDVKWSFISS